MFQVLYPEKDTTIYSQFPDKNTGTDQILELVKNTIGSPSLDNDLNDVYYSDTYISRILIKFDLSQLNSNINNAQYYLVLRATEATNLPIEYTVEARPLSGSFINGTGYYNNNPSITNGSSWTYKTSKLEGKQWLTSSFNSGTTASYGNIAGGSTWYTSSICSQSFSYDPADIRMDVTNIVKQWLSGSISNDGFVVKLPDSKEFDTSVFGSLKFFSKDSHTIFIPRLEAYWDDSVLTGTGSFTEVNDESFVINCKNLQEYYTNQSKARVNLSVRDLYVQQTYATSSNYLVSKRLPISSYFQIQDVVTDEIIVPFHPSGTRVNCGDSGNYIKFDCFGLLPERYYKLVFKAEFENGEIVKVIDDNHQFKIRRN